MFNVVSSEFMLFFESYFKFRHLHMYITELFEKTDSKYESAKVVHLALCTELVNSVVRAPSACP